MKDNGFVLAYLDVLFNMLLAFISLFILSYILINPITDKGKIDPVTEILILHTWPDDSKVDMDIWVEGPGKDAIVGYYNKEGGYFQLDRDDLGTKNDMFMVNGEIQTVERNIETVTINAIVPGDYYINVHFFGPSNYAKEDFYETSTIEVIDMRPYRRVFKGDVKIKYREEKTVVAFTVTDLGDIINISTAVERKIKGRAAKKGKEVPTP